MQIGVAKPRSETTRTTEKISRGVMNQGAAAQRFRSTLRLSRRGPAVSFRIHSESLAGRGRPGGDGVRPAWA